MAITKKGNKWYVYTYMGKKADGKQDIAWSPGFDSEDEAKDHEAMIRLGQTTAHRCTIKLIDYLEKQWLPYKCMSDEEYRQGQKPPKGKLGYRTKEQYEAFCNIIRKHPIGSCQLGKLTPLQFENYKNWRLAGDEKKGIKKVLPSTVTAELKMIRQALKKAKSWKLIRENPMDDVELFGTERAKEISHYDESQAKALLKLVKAEAPKLYAALALALGAGLRDGEICGLRLSSADLTNMKITINGTTQRQKGGFVVFLEDQTKTKNSKATLAIDAGLTAVLKEQKERQAKLKSAADDKWEDNIGMFFTHEDGRLWSPDYLGHAFAQFIKFHGLPKITLHQLRHSHAMILRDKGVPMEVISDRLRHYDSAFTHRIYAPKSVKSEDSAIAAIAGLI